MAISIDTRFLNLSANIVNLHISQTEILQSENKTKQTSYQTSKRDNLAGIVRCKVWDNTI